MSSDIDRVPLAACALPGTVRLTDRVLKLAEQFQASVADGWITAFVWCDRREKRANKNAPWEDQGPGLDLGAYRNEQIPPEAICRSGALRYVVCVGKDVIDAHADRTIDLNASEGLVLR